MPPAANQIPGSIHQAHTRSTDPLMPASAVRAHARARAGGGGGGGPGLVGGGGGGGGGAAFVLGQVEDFVGSPCH